MHTLVSVLWRILCFGPNDNLFKNIFDFTTAGEWDCVAAVERLPGLHYCVYYTIIDFNEVDIRIYLPEKVIVHQGR